MDQSPRNELQDVAVHGKQSVVASLLAAGRPVKSTAEELGIDPSTIHRWLADASFKKLVVAHRQAFLDEALGKLSSVASAAVVTLAKSLKSDSESLRIRAATAILDRLVSLRQAVELEDRLIELEQWVAGNAHKLEAGKWEIERRRLEDPPARDECGNILEP